jgi:hypothetical protein
MDEPAFRCDLLDEIEIVAVCRQDRNPDPDGATVDERVVADYNTLSGFLGSSGSASNYQWASWYRIDLGVLSAGTRSECGHRSFDPA